jgi:monoamine oxidase
LADKEIVAEAMATLRRIYGEAIPDPAAWLITRWAADPFAGGSYSYTPVGADSEDYEQMAAPVGDRLFFAGEATHREHSATVHGAFLSGLREAQRIRNL